MERDIGIWYERYYKDLYQYIYVMTLSSFDTEDILHNVFVKAMKGIRFFRGDSTAKTWLFTIARNECINYIKKNRKEVCVEDVAIKIKTMGTDDKVLQKEAVDRILEYIQSKEEPVKSLLILRLLEERSFVEIGTIIHKTDVWCRTNFFRNKKKIAELLEKFELED